jgi:hypothetical protein
MIFPEYKCIFMHINKTGGTSVENALLISVGWPLRQSPRLFALNDGGEQTSDIPWLNEGKSRRSRSEKHIDVKETVELYGKERWEKYFTFTFVRNPWDRMVSLFFWRKKVGFIPENLSFKDFVMNFHFWKWSRGRGPMPRKHINFKISRWYQRNSKPQCLWFDSEFKFDYVGRFETLQQDFNAVCCRLNIKKIKLPHKFKTNHSHYSKYYDKETKNKVYKMWGVDAESFKYKFENQ